MDPEDDDASTERTSDEAEVPVEASSGAPDPAPSAAEPVPPAPDPVASAAGPVPPAPDPVASAAGPVPPAPDPVASAVGPEAAADIQAIAQIKAVTEEMFRQQAEHLGVVNEARMRSQRRESIMLVMTTGACVAAIVAAVAAVIALAT